MRINDNREGIMGEAADKATTRRAVIGQLTTSGALVMAAAATDSTTTQAQTPPQTFGLVQPRCNGRPPYAPSCAPPTRFSHGLGQDRQFAALQQNACNGGEADLRRTGSAPPRLSHLRHFRGILSGPRPAPPSQSEKRHLRLIPQCGKIIVSIRRPLVFPSCET
jgi:hypothetical protein